MINLFYNNFKGYSIKAEMACGGGGIMKVSPVPACPIKSLIVYIQEQNAEKTYLIAK